jgi:hypothetical protein
MPAIHTRSRTCSLSPIQISLRTPLACAVLALLTACGGGGGGGGGGATPKAWKGAAPIESSTSTTRSPDIAYAANDQAMAVWLQRDAAVDNVWARRYDATTGTWGTAVLIETDDTGDAYHPKVAFDASGNGMMVWYQFDGLNTSIWASRFTNATQIWSAATLIETSSAGNAVAPQVAFDASGNALAVWHQSDGTRDNIWANRFNAGTGLWGTAELIETNNAGGASSPQIAFDASGNALAVWDQSDGTRDNIWANRYNGSTGLWGTAALIENIATGNAGDPQPAFDGAGNAFVVWQQSDGTRNNIWANRYNATTGLWGTPGLLESDNTGPANFPQIAMDSSGFAWAVWQQSDGTRTNIWANRYNAFAGTWGVATLLENETGTAFAPQLAMNASGNTMVVWSQNLIPSIDTVARHFDASTGTWGAPQTIETDDAGDASVPQVAMDPSGRAVAVWRQNDGTGNYDILANRYE